MSNAWVLSLAEESGLVVFFFVGNQGAVVVDQILFVIEVAVFEVTAVDGEIIVLDEVVLVVHL